MFMDSDTRLEVGTLTLRSGIQVRFEPEIRPRQGNLGDWSVQRGDWRSPGVSFYEHACFSSDQLTERRYELHSVLGVLVFLLYAMRRVDCRHCQTVVVEEVPWGTGKNQLTNDYMLFLARWARHFPGKKSPPRSGSSARTCGKPI